MKSTCAGAVSSTSKSKSQFEQLKLLAWSVCPKLVLFFKACVVYAVLYAGEGGGLEDAKRSEGVQQPRGFFFPMFKCLPIVALMFFVALHALRSGAAPGDLDAVDHVAASPALHRRSRAFPLKIFLALLVSCAGDFLIAVDKFDLGFASFLLSHVVYMSAFGMQWVRRVRPLALYLLSSFVTFLVFQSGGYFYGHPPVFYIVINIIYTLAIFATLTSTIVYLASYEGAPTERKPKSSGRSASPSKTRRSRAPSRSAGWLERASAWLDVARAVRVCAVCGAALFVTSDFLLMWSDFVHKVPLFAMLVLPTYYGAQLGLALAVADPSI